MHDSRSAPVMPVHWLGVVAALLVSPLVLLGLVLELALPVALGAVLLESVDVPPIDCAHAPVANATLRAAASILRVMTVSCYVVGGNCAAPVARRVPSGLRQKTNYAALNDVAIARPISHNTATKRGSDHISEQRESFLNDVCVAESCDVDVAVADFAQHFVGVLAEFRRLCADRARRVGKFRHDAGHF